MEVKNPGESGLPRFWQGLATLDIASMYIEQGKLAEGKQYAEQGYKCFKGVDYKQEDFDIAAINAEFDALQVLMDVNLLLGKMEEAANLLRRAETLKPKVDADGGVFQ